VLHYTLLEPTSKTRPRKSLQEIPYGQTCSYEQQAINLKNKKAVRAVASANGNNRIAIIIPCHRVLGKNGNLTGYVGGLDRKKWLLELSLKLIILSQLDILKIEKATRLLFYSMNDDMIKFFLDVIIILEKLRTLSWCH
jgi:O-6-methylguanine DNA methyltransferase